MKDPKQAIDNFNIEYRPVIVKLHGSYFFAILNDEETENVYATEFFTGNDVQRYTRDEFTKQDSLFIQELTYHIKLN